MHLLSLLVVVMLVWAGLSGWGHGGNWDYRPREG